ncbi:multifunctional CCA protein [Candidatus Riesia pediculicola]|uniref:multifunctional CCA protein n=1 Tax=Candidatus Riesia pediculicola TaxID=401619 RepID=UPI0009C273F2|nr:multifunctional CCA protein [Candidatus Riesia pediculicola]ARC54448.1 hypothetical protein AOE57_02630 [Candidatus Riesia pediculicola]
MKIYLVGGAVRDQILGIPISDRDWLVVGSSPQEMIRLGFQQVGRDFPVFLHPVTKEEYSLARIDRKIGSGHTGFQCFSSPSVTIEEDLYRRDLTINAIAKTTKNKTIDPFFGIKDIQKRIIRHVSNAFSEDPIRVLRTARFYAKLSEYYFTIYHKTWKIIEEMVQQEDLKTVSKERVWIETKKALSTSSPDLYFKMLFQCGALSVLFPEIQIILTKSFKKKSSLTSFIDQKEYIFLVIKKSALLTKSIEVRFAALCSNFTVFFYDNHMSNSKEKKINSAVQMVRSFCDRMRVPTKTKKLSVAIAKVHQNVQNIQNSCSKEVIKIFDQMDVWRKPKNIDQLITVCKAHYIVKNRLELGCYYPQGELLMKIFKKVSKSSLKIDFQKMKNKEIRGTILKNRLKIIEKVMNLKKIRKNHLR